MATKIGTTIVSATGVIGPVTIAADDAVIIGLKFEGGATLSGLSDGTNTALVAVQRAYAATPAEPEAAIAYFLGHPGGTVSFTASFAGTAAFVQMDLQVWRGLGSLDGTSSGSGTGPPFSASEISTTGAGVVVQMLGGFQSTAGVTAGGSPTFTRDAPTEFGESFMQYLVSGSAQSVTPGASWASSTDRYVLVAAAFKDGAAGPVSTISSVSNANPKPGDSVTLTVTNAGATQGAGTLTLGGEAQAVTAWADASVTVTVGLGGLKYGSSSFILTGNGAGASSPFAITLTPPTGYAAVDVGTPNPNKSLRVTGYPDIAPGDQIVYSTSSGLLSIANDGVVTTAPSVYSFDFAIWSAGSGWGRMATKLLYSTQLTDAKGMRLHAQRILRAVQSAATWLDPRNWGGVPLQAEKWFAPELTASDVPTGVVSSATSATTLSTPAGAQTNNGSVASAGSATTASTPAGAQIHVGAVANATSATSLSAPAGTGAGNGSVASANSATTLSTPTGAQTHAGSVAGAASATSASAPGGTQIHVGVVAAASSATSLSAPAGSGDGSALVAGVTSATTLTSPAGTQVHVGAVAAAASSTQAASLAGTQLHSGAVAGATSATSLSTPAGAGEAGGGLVASALSSTTMSSLAGTQIYVGVVAGCSSATTAAAIGSSARPTPAARTLRVPFEDRALRVPFEDRTLVIT